MWERLDAEDVNIFSKVLFKHRVGETKGVAKSHADCHKITKALRTK